MKYEKSCGAVVFTKENNEYKFLIVQQLQGFHGFPKGHMEADETEEQTALREIFEEVGVKANLIDGFRVVDEHIIPSKVDTVKQIVYFLAEYKNQNVKFQKSELSAVKLLAFDEAYNTFFFLAFDEAYNTFEYESSKRILSAAYDHLSKAVY